MDVTNLLYLTTELVFGFSALFIITKILGKTQIEQITPFDFISALVLGELLGNGIYNKKINLFFILYAMGLWALLIYVIEKTAQRYKGIRKTFDGQPLIIIRNGQIDYDVMKKEKLNVNELLSMLRKKDIFSIREVAYTILEPSGEISVIRKRPYDIPKNEDLNTPEKPVYMPITFIIDGEIIYDNLESSGYDKKWLEEELRNNNVDDINKVFYAEWKQDEGLHISYKKPT